ncbi:hypothetical protein F0L68_17215 [Solihabitans fulvus]|uniref:Uncharacterized protein n=1 Tax=Solihabitans fulvus TaxID=1892852 RepID=A0A5B2XFD0_9PSEU|nr:hypothetical protein [Solihabitans fulvus]KAA2261512.1 hypothetical protein F0L68_17215 [Solihabitans fulvus]
MRTALAELLQVCGFESITYGTSEKGSWFGKLFTRAPDGKAVQKLGHLARKVERAAELKYIGGQRSENDEREANAIAKLAQAMESQTEVVIRTSSVLFLKVDGRVLAWVLSEAEIDGRAPAAAQNCHTNLGLLLRLLRGEVEMFHRYEPGLARHVRDDPTGNLAAHQAVRNATAPPSNRCHLPRTESHSTTGHASGSPSSASQNRYPAERL